MRSLLATLLLISTPILAATACANLKNLSIPNTKITLAESVAAGAFRPPTGDKGGAQQFADLPAFCRIQATLTPTSDSDIKIELWMPVAARWNSEASRYWQWRTRRRSKHTRRSAGRRCARGIRGSGQQYRARRRLQLCHRPPGKGQGFRLSLLARNDHCVQGADRRLL